MGNIFNILTSYSVAVIIVVLSNIALAMDNEELLNVVVIYGFVTLIGSNFLSLQETFHGLKSIDAYLMRYIVVTTTILVSTLILIYYIFGEFIEIQYLLLVCTSYILYINVAILRFKDLFLYSFLLILCSHLLLIFTLKTEWLMGTFFVAIFLYIHALLLYKIYKNSPKGRVVTLHDLYVKIKYNFYLYINSIVFGELDRYIVAITISPVMFAIYYSILSVISLIPNVLNTNFIPMINKIKKRQLKIKKITSTKRYYLHSFRIIALVSLVFFPVYYDNYALAVLVFALFVKYEMVIGSFEVFLLLYVKGKVKLINTLTLKINSINMLIMLCLFITPSIYLIVIAKLLSSVPLYLVVR